jgi:hypothetical protein
MNRPVRDGGRIVMPEAEFEQLLERAAETGARKALDDVGLGGDVQRQMLEAAARRPRDRDDLADRLRDGQF